MPRRALQFDQNIIGPVERGTLVEKAVEQLEKLIRDGKLGPGARLPSERELSRMLGLGRPSVREALQAIQAKGLVQAHPGRGTFVRDLSKNSVVPFADWETLYHYSASEVMEVRLTIEPSAAALAAKRATPDDIQVMERAMEQMRRGIENDDLAERVLGDTNFHDAITKASKNRIYQTMMRSINHLLIESRRTSLGVPGRSPIVLDRHQVVLDAVRAGDAERAAEAMRAPLITATQDMRIPLAL